MSIFIREDKGNSILIQAGNGVPSHLSTIGSLFVDKNTAIPYINKNGLSNWSQIFDNTSIIGNIPSTGVVEFGGILKTSNTTFSVSAATGWIVDTVTNPYQPIQTYVTFSGQTGIDSPYRTSATITYILLTSGGTLAYQPTPPTPQQRRQNIYLGKIGHPDKATYSIAFQVTDHVQSPMSQLRDMFIPIPLINGGIGVYANTGLTISNTAGTLYGLGISFPSSPLSPNTVSVSAQTPVTFQYRTQTGGTLTATTLVDPLYYDNGGTRTAIGSPAKQATNQRVFVLQDGSFRIQYGQHKYTDLATAVAAIPTEAYVTFPNWRDNGILIGILSMESDVTDLTNTAKAKFTGVSKFGETTGAAGVGGGTATLQSAYDNSTTPEIITNSILDGFTIRRGSASDSDNLIEFQNGTGGTVSTVNALGNATFKNVLINTTINDGYELDVIGSARTTNLVVTANTSLQTTNASTITLSSSASTISLNNTTQQQIKFFSGGTGVPTLSTYSPGVKIILNDNIDSSISTGMAIGVDAGSLWYGTDLAGNGHDWYAGTRKLASLVGAAGFQLFGLGSPTSAAMTISGTSALGSKGGLGYMDFLRVYNNYPSATNPNKFFRTTSGGTLQILRNDYNATIFDLTDSGILSVGGGNVATSTSNDGTSNYLSFNANNGQIYDDGNFHIHSRSAGASMWINTNGAQLNLLTQSPTSTGSIGSGIAIATTTLNGYVTINTGRTITTAAAYGYLTTGGAGTYPGGSQSVTISLYANNRIWGQEIDAFSDERMKDIKGNISLEEGIKLVNNLKPIKYTWKEGDDKGLKAGYSAQQVIKSGFDNLIGVIPREGLEETVDDDGFVSPKDTQFSMNYDQVVPYHGVVIKHLLEKIEQLEKEIKELKAK